MSECMPPELNPGTLERSTIGAAWCVSCYPTKEYAQFIYRGHSLCEKHLKKMREK